ncbi:uncharacterized protein BJX67DRAFT_295736 [Aspergillus lucknowensis]|uniref:Uncharacterized protein n=1 Tax=Aspergillus lucknowensis TaxID=176173 RepID=A0ABR4LDH9_9EURO
MGLTSEPLAYSTPVAIEPSENNQRSRPHRSDHQALVPPVTVTADDGHPEDHKCISRPPDDEYPGVVRELQARDQHLAADYAQLNEEYSASIQRLTHQINRYERYIEQQEARLQRREGSIQSLQSSLAEMRGQYQELQAIVLARQEEALQSMTVNKGYAPKEDRLIRDDLLSLGEKMRNWARKYGMLSFAQLEREAGSGKELIINNLSGYCAHHDLDALAKELPISPDRIPALLLQCLLAKDIFGGMFTDPFFAFTRIEGNSTRNPPTSEEMQILLDAMTQVDESEAHIWRSQTLRNLSDGPEVSLQARIKTLCPKIVARFLSGPARGLLKPAAANSSDADQCVQELQSLYHGAAQLALSLWMQRASMACQDLQGLSFFTVDSPIMSAHRLHHLDEEDTALDGKKVLLVVQPAIIAYGSENAEHYDRYKVWAPAVVLVEGNNK